MYQQPRFIPAGDSALCVELGNHISPEVLGRVRALYQVIEDEKIAGVAELVPSYRSILVYYDPLRISPQELEARLAGLSVGPTRANLRAPKVLEIPTVYGGQYGPDLGYVAEYNRLTPQEVVRIHSGTTYLVYMLGFTPGFPYLGGMAATIATPRLPTPRSAIPAGSVGIAESQTGIYPTESPGGWRIIGRTPVQLFDPLRAPPVPVDVGDYIRFVPVTEDIYMEIQEDVQAGSYQLAPSNTK